MTFMSITRRSLAWTGVFKMAAWFWLDSDTNLCSCSLSGFCDLFLWWPLSCVVWYDNRLVRCLLWDALYNSSRDCKKSLHLMISLLFLYWTALLEIQLLTVFPLCVSEWRIHWVLSLSKRILKTKTLNSYLSFYSLTLDICTSLQITSFYLDSSKPFTIDIFALISYTVGKL